MINILRGHGESKQYAEKMDNVSRMMKTIRRNQRKNKRNLKLYNKMKSVFGELKTSLDMVKELVNKFEDMSIETSEIKNGK